jgi:3-oxoacyl-[acyl-carrier protein] reductase
VAFVGREIEQASRTDRVAIVTGGSRGIGRAITVELARRGYAVVVAYADDPAAVDAVIDEILAAHGTATAVRGDVADDLDTERLFAETIEAFGGVDVVVHAVDEIGPGASIVNRHASREVRDGGAIVDLGASGVPRDVIEAATCALARQLRDRDITVNAIAAGGGWGESAVAIAKVVAFLVSDDGHWVNGQVIGRLD